MKKNLILLLAISLITTISCTQLPSTRNQSEMNEEQREPIVTVRQATEFISDNFKKMEETLWIADSLNDKIGMNMALIGDKVLKSGYMPNGFEQKSNYRIYKYKKLKEKDGS